MCNNDDLKTVADTLTKMVNHNQSILNMIANLQSGAKSPEDIISQSNDEKEKE
jgi:hypothetical protein